MQEFAVRSRPPASVKTRSAQAPQRASRSSAVPEVRVAASNAGTSALSGHDFARVPVHTGPPAADPAAADVAATSAAAPSVQRDPLPADSQQPAPAGEAAGQAPAGWQGMLVNAIASALQLPGLGAVLLARFGQGLGKDLVKEGPAALGRLAGRVVSMTPSDYVQLE